MTPKEIEELEHTYLREFYHFTKFVERRMLRGFATKEKIKDDWLGKWDPNAQENERGISSFAIGAERIVYALFNSQGFGQPNSCPVGSDLFFETPDAFIHIDLKTVQTRNIGDYNTSIFVGDNQNSYKGKIPLRNGESREYVNSALPPIYNNQGNNKPCLTFFFTILYDEESLDVLNINIICMPNGALTEVYGSDVLKAGKTPGKIRFNFSKADEFRLLDGKPKRVKVVYFNEKVDKKFLKNLEYLYGLYKTQNELE